MSDKSVSNPEKGPIQISKIRVKPGTSIYEGKIILFYHVDFNSPKKKTKQLKAKEAGVLSSILVKEGDVVQKGSELYVFKSGCSHSTVMNDLCAECGFDLQKDDKMSTGASVPMVHTIPSLKVSEEQARILGRADENRLINDKKLVLLVDLDQTLIHTTNDNIDPSIKDIHHFQLNGARSPWYHTRLRPGTHQFLESISKWFELHICTFGSRNYAHQIAHFLDKQGKYFSHRILSRDECFDAHSKTANLKALFPCGDNMVCIIDDREDVWNYASNLIHVKPYHFFRHTGDINAPPGCTKTDNDVTQGFSCAQLAKGVTIKQVSSSRNKESQPSLDQKRRRNNEDVKENEKDKTEETQEKEITTNEATSTVKSTSEDLEIILEKSSSEPPEVHEELKVLEEKISKKNREIVSIVKIVRSKSTEDAIPVIELDAETSNSADCEYIPTSSTKSTCDKESKLEYVPSAAKTMEYEPSLTVYEPSSNVYEPSSTLQTDEYVPAVPSAEYEPPVTGEINRDVKYVPSSTTEKLVPSISSNSKHVGSNVSSSEPSGSKVSNSSDLKESNVATVDDEMEYVPVRTSLSEEYVPPVTTNIDTKLKYVPSISTSKLDSKSEANVPGKSDDVLEYVPSKTDSNLEYVPSKTDNLEYVPSKTDNLEYVPSKTDDDLKYVPSKTDNLEYVPSKTDDDLKYVPSKTDNLEYVPSKTDDDLKYVPSKTDNLEYVPSKTDNLEYVPSKTDDNLEYVPTNSTNSDSKLMYVPTTVSESVQYVPSSISSKSNDSKGYVPTSSAEREYIASSSKTESDNASRTETMEYEPTSTVGDSRMKYVTTTTTPIANVGDSEMDYEPTATSIGESKVDYVPTSLAYTPSSTSVEDEYTPKPMENEYVPPGVSESIPYIPTSIETSVTVEQNTDSTNPKCNERNSEAIEQTKISKDATVNKDGSHSKDRTSKNAGDAMNGSVKDNIKAARNGRSGDGDKTNGSDVNKENIDGMKNSEEVSKDLGENYEGVEDKGNREDSKSKDEMKEVEEVDDYLLYLEEILKHIHEKFYSTVQQMREKQDTTLPDLKCIIPAIRCTVLDGVHLVFSGVVPSKMRLEENKAYSVATSLGAVVSDQIRPATTHLVAQRPGTAKVNDAKRRKNIHIVTLDWLWMCAERWERVDERLFPVLPHATAASRTPPAHCASPPYPCPPSPPPPQFCDSINPLMTLTSEDIANMDKEVEDIFNETDDDDDDDEAKENSNDSGKRKRADSSDSSEVESLSGDRKGAWSCDGEEIQDRQILKSKRRKKRKSKGLKGEENATDAQNPSHSLGGVALDDPATKHRGRNRDKQVSNKRSENKLGTNDVTDSSCSDLDSGDGATSDSDVNSDGETINSRFRRCASLPSDCEIEGKENDEDEWNLMGDMLEREFM